MVEVKTAGELDVMREAGRVVATALAATREHAKVGTKLTELDELAADIIASARAKPSFLHYHPDWAPTPFAGVICASVNDAVVHGVPTAYQLQDGDLVSIDCGAYIDGLHGDAAISFVVGQASPDDERLIRATEEALRAGIQQMRPGNRLGDVSYAIGATARKDGYGLLEGNGGHGIGRAMHEAPFVPNEGRPHRGMQLKPGLVLALEPMMTGGGRDDYVTDEDGWTLRTTDGSRAAHVEHTVAVTENGPRVLTLP